MAKTKEKNEVDNGEDSIKNLMGSLLKGYKDSHYNFVTNERIPISTGSLLLDGYVHLKSGSVVRLAGSLESGKTSQCLLLMSNYLQTIPKSRGLYCKSEGRLSEEIQLRSGLKFVYSQEEWEYGTVFVLETNVMETTSDIIQSLLKNMYDKGEKLVFAIDSLDGMILQKDLEKSASDNMMPAGVPKMTKMLFRKLALPINKYDALAIITSQYSETFKIDMFSKDKPQPVQGVGGSSVSHQPDWIFEYGIRYTSHYILEDEDAKPDPVKNKALGHIVTLTLRKTTNEKTGTTIKIPIKYGQIGNSIWRSREVAEMVINWGLIERNKNTYEFSQDIIKQAQADGVELKDKLVGNKNLYNYFEENSNVSDWFYKKFKEIHS